MNIIYTVEHSDMCEFYGREHIYELSIDQTNLVYFVSNKVRYMKVNEIKNIQELPIDETNLVYSAYNIVSHEVLRKKTYKSYEIRVTNDQRT